MRSRHRFIVAAIALGLLVTGSTLAVRALLPTRLVTRGPIMPDSPLGRLLHDAHVAERRGDDRLAIDLYTQAFHDEGVDWAIRGLLFKYRAGAHERLQQYDQAEADWTARLKIVPVLPTDYKDRGVFYLRRGAYDKALTDFRAALARDPKDQDLVERIKTLESR